MFTRWFRNIVRFNFIFVFLLLLLMSQRIISTALTNLGMLGLENVILSREVSISENTDRLGVISASQARDSMSVLEQASEVFRDGTLPRRAIGRAALISGQWHLAAEILTPLAESAKQDPLLFQDAILALSRSGNYSRLIDLYQNSKYKKTIVDDDTMALAYIHQAVEKGVQTEDGLAFLKAALTFRPDDLFSLYHLYNFALSIGEEDNADSYKTKLVYFPVEAIKPANDQLLEYTGEIIPDLVEEKIWSVSEAKNVINFLIREYKDSTYLVRLLNQLTINNPGDLDWLFLLAELYHRSDLLKEAETTYQRVLEINPEYAQAYLRLGFIAETRFETQGGQLDSLSEAAKMYSQYYQMAPDDLMGLRRLAAACSALEQKTGIEEESCYKAAQQTLMTGDWWKTSDQNSRSDFSAAAILQQELKFRTENQYVVSELLEVPLDSVKTGPNLLKNGGFEQWSGDKPEEWSWSPMFNREPFAGAAFTGGPNSLFVFGGQKMAGVTGFWFHPDPELEKPRAGFWADPLELKGNTLYLISFYYRTNYLEDGNVGIWISNDPDAPVDHEQMFSNTHGQWREVVAIGLTGLKLSPLVKPLIRLWGAGGMEFDQVELREIILEHENIPPDFNFISGLR
jgi:tetratricopeptide (TPR) repeat protein